MEEPEIEVTFVPMFHDDHDDRFILMKFVKFTDDPETYSYMLTSRGGWTDFDPLDYDAIDDYLSDINNLPRIAAEALEEG